MEARCESGSDKITMDEIHLKDVAMNLHAVEVDDVQIVDDAEVGDRRTNEE